MGFVVNLAHMLVTGPVFVYVGLAETKPRWMYHFLLVFGLLLVGYFVYVISTKELSQYHVWLGIHLLIFVPLMLAVGIMQDESPRILFSLLLAIGIAAIGYHAIRLYQHYLASSSSS